ncbi:serine O-acetyltransferase, partial [Bacteroides reticulotermitis]
VVNASSIGKNCIIYQNVTIGSRNLKEPIIGDNVVITAHAILLGDIKIGNGSKIGPGAVVVKDVPGNAVVVSPSPIIIKQDNEKVNIVLS